MRKIRKSLSAKVFLWVMCALTICSFAIYGIVMVMIPKQYTSLTNNDMEDKINQLMVEIDNSSYEDAHDKIYNFCVQNHVYAILLNEGNSVSFGNMDLIDKENSSFTMTMNVQLKDIKSLSTLSIIASSSTANEILNSFFTILPFIILIILVISGISAVLCSRVIVHPIIEISKVSKRMANLDMTWKCEVKRQDELGILAESLNCLSNKLSTAMGDLEEANEKLREDLVQMNSIEKQRRDFFAAASHELKTPITIMKGQIESMILKIGRYKNVEEVLPQTLVEIEKMEDLVKEILAITKMEMDGLSNKTEEVSINEILQAVINLLEPMALDKNIEITINQEDTSVTGNKALLEKAFHNIIGNAIKYSPEGSEVVIDLSKEDFKIKNTNVELPLEDISLLFTPFYRVEKSHNKSMGGSGLGLYIVKTILELHGFLYEIKNENQSVVFTITF